MKRPNGSPFRRLCGLALLLTGEAAADTTISATNRHAYGANLGWLDARGDVTNGAVIGQFFCTGHVWSANCGWISLGNGPTNGWQYGNAAASDWGVNHDGVGRLRGLAYGANIGWIAFETNGDPRVSLLTGNLSGFAYGANLGWISLSNSQAFVRTDRLGTGPDADGDGLPDAWEFSITSSLTNLNGGAADRDGDGVTDTGEYLADTDPLDDTSLLEITALARGGGTNRVAWRVEPTRLYRLEQAGGATHGEVWTDSGLGLLAPGSGLAVTGVVAEATATGRAYRAVAILPLAH